MLRSSPQLYRLDLGLIDFSRVMPLFSSAQLFTTALSYLDVSHCNISDSELIQLGTKISICRSLKQLYIWGNPFTDDGLTNFLELFMTNRYSRLKSLWVDLPPLYTRQPNQSSLKVLEKINQFRSEMGYPHLIINSDVETISNNALSNTLLVEVFRKGKDGTR